MKTFPHSAVIKKIGTTYLCCFKEFLTTAYHICNNIYARYKFLYPLSPICVPTTCELSEGFVLFTRIALLHCQLNDLLVCLLKTCTDPQDTNPAIL